ncbi:MAG TPA: SMC-Scp complex subunit ScpB [Pyrinomonadaceae bacterium]|nr:SMC-Scp complex subunit ScpB [Pyrinomonadaceae bacterium]
MSREEEQIENESDTGTGSVEDAVAAVGENDYDADDVAGVESQDDSNEFDDDADTDDEDDEVVIYDADAEDAAEKLAAMRREMAERVDGGFGGAVSVEDDIAPGGSRSMAELISVIESLIFVSEDPLPAKTLADVLKEDRGWVEMAVEELAKEFNERNGGLMLREVAGGWQFATRPENHEYVRTFLKSRPSAKLSLAALETLAVIAYKQPITVPEILEIRGVQSSSAIKTLLDKRLIISKGRKETVGRPMLYGTSKEFLLQFGLRDLSELPNVEDFEDLATGGA